MPNIKELCQKIDSKMAYNADRKQPNILYHYCSADTFSKIIESKQLHLSHVFNTNDYSEMQVGRRIIRKTINKIKQKNPVDSEKLENLYKDYQANFDFVSPFIFCLSESKDLLSQWRGYAENATGFSIGFDVQKLQKCLEIKLNEHTHPSLVHTKKVLNKVIYEENLQELLIELCLKFSMVKEFDQDIFNWCYRSPISLCPPTLSCGPNGLIFEPNKNMDNALSNLLHLSKCFKHTTFNEECEWRIMSTEKNIPTPTAPGLNLYFKQVKNKIIPYIYLDFSACSHIITEIVLGPRNQNKIEVLKYFLNSRGIDCLINGSNIPYR